jgi:hypothetical protein
MVQRVSRPHRARGQRNRPRDPRRATRSSSSLVTLAPVATTVAVVTCVPSADRLQFVVRCSRCGTVRAYGMHDHSEAIRVLVRHQAIHMAG